MICSRNRPSWVAAGLLLSAMIGGAVPASASTFSASYQLDSVGTMSISESFLPNIPLFSGGPLLPDAFSATVNAMTWGLADLQGGGLQSVTTGPNSELIDFALDALDPAGNELFVVYAHTALGDNTTFSVAPSGGGGTITGDVTEVSEPATISLLAAGLLALMARRKQQPQIR